MRDHTANPSPLRFQQVRLNEVPQGREGKYKKVINQILDHVETLAPGAALKIPLDGLAVSKPNIRAALNRATHKKGLSVATSSDSSNLYIWKVPGKS